MHISLQIIIAALSVLGLYFCLRIIASLIFTNEQITAAVIIKKERQLEDLDLLISEAEEELLFTHQRKVAVFVPQSIWDACEIERKEKILSLCRDLGIPLYTGSRPQ